MTIKAGERMPAGKFKVMGEGGPQDLTTAQLFDGKRVVLFSVPGAFTPTCNAKHLPGYLRTGRGAARQGRRHDCVHGGQRRVRHECLGQERRTWATR